MKRLLLLAVIIFAACEIDMEALTGSPPRPEAEEVEIIRDMGGRTIRIAAAWPYLPFVTDGPPPDPAVSLTYELDRLIYEQVQLVSRQYNIRITNIPISHGDIMPTLTTSVMAGNPFAELVMLDGEMIFPAITGNLIYALEEFVPRGSDIFGEERFLSPSARFVDFHWAIKPFAISFDGMFLGVNMDIIRASGADNPLALYESGEWTFDNFYEILQLVNRRDDRNYGLSGAPGDIITHLIAANNGVLTEDFAYAMDNPATMRALGFAHRLFNTSGLWLNAHGATDWNSNFFAFSEGRSAFFPITEWAIAETNINFSFAIIPFPGGPDNSYGYSFMQGFETGLGVPRGTRNPAEVYTVFEAIQRWGSPAQKLQRDTANISNNFPTGRDMLRAVDILGRQGKFDIGMAIPGFNWMNIFIAEGFINGSLNPESAVSRFRQPQQSLLDEALRGWLLE